MALQLVYRLALVFLPLACMGCTIPRARSMSGLAREQWVMAPESKLVRVDYFPGLVGWEKARDPGINIELECQGSKQDVLAWYEQNLPRYGWYKVIRATNPDMRDFDRRKPKSMERMLIYCEDLPTDERGKPHTRCSLSITRNAEWENLNKA